MSSSLAPSSPAPLYSSAGGAPASPSRNPRTRRSEFSSTLLGDDIGSPLAYPGTPLRSGITNYDSPRTPRASSFVRTPFYNSQAAGSPLTPGYISRNTVSSLGVGNNTAPADTQDTDPSLAVRLIWGTTVNIHEVMTSFRGFLNHFKVADRKIKYNQAITADDNEPFYPRLLRKIHDNRSDSINLDCRNLLAYRGTHKLYDQLVKYPQEVIPLMDHTIKAYYLELYPDTDETVEQIKIRPFNLESSVNMRELDPQNVDQLVTIKGLMIRSSPIIPDMKEAFFRCLSCEQTMTVQVDRGRIMEPTRCPRESCASENTMSLVHNRCVFADKQVCRLQETPDVVPDGQTPQTVSLCMYDELVDVSKPGDRLEITGVFRSVPVRVNPRQRTIRALFRTYLDVVHVKRTDGKRLQLDRALRTELGPEVYDETDEIETVNVNDEQDILEIASSPTLYDRLSRSLAPSIYELEDVKKGVLLQLFGGTQKVFQRSGSPRFRGEINVLLVGDPGTSKSQLLQYVHKISPRGVYTSGKGSSAVGLTAYITRDPDTRQLVLESGALVLSDGGVCCIDEFDKMSDATRSVLHEVMEQQTISVAKAGIITTLNARTSICACANPTGSRWNPSLSVPQNVNLPPPLLSRFDLLYLILDRVDEDADRELARHLVSLYMEDQLETAGVDILSVERLTKYISYAKEKIHPILSEDAGRRLVDLYVELRKQGQDRNERRVTATTRQLESMIRMSEAHARMRLSDTVEVSDVEEASRLLRSAIKDYATDPKTGRIDMDLILMGTGSHERHLQDDLERELHNLINSQEQAQTEWSKLLAAFNAQSSVVSSIYIISVHQ
ncbi:MCM2/3/5 family-domain-containing protein [Zychaea mexicana]|uniref:MCM2/3/5 family-domain-containing protein n=1 Tax=Zychaea mexicana TaxID=64656 RepID=UPI0022FDF480|nr:MCM2/3/5 family-domain-containing protein [Zychaea mexicana]KAI9498256.1 MCM2/3/5 family-domain-containing protein [Zychaea mexicana]